MLAKEDTMSQKIAIHAFDDAAFTTLATEAEKSAEIAKQDRKALTDAAKTAIVNNASGQIDGAAAQLATDAAQVASLFGYSRGDLAHGALAKAFIGKVAQKARKAF